MITPPDINELKLSDSSSFGEYSSISEEMLKTKELKKVKEEERNDFTLKSLREQILIKQGLRDIEIHVGSHFYFFEENIWKCDREMKKEKGRIITATILSFKLITYNVFFDLSDINIRVEHLISTLIQENADFICLQEVTGKFLSILSSNSFMQKNYCLGDNPLRPLNLNFAGYSSLIIVRRTLLEDHRIANFRKIGFPGLQKRNCFLLDFVWDYKNNDNKRVISIGTSHLESEDLFSNIRIEQLTKVSKIQKKQEEAIFCGDFNFGEESTEQKFLETNELWKQYKDVWMQINKKKNSEKEDDQKQEERFTFDSKRNKMIERFFHKDDCSSSSAIKNFTVVQKRIDRIMFKPSFFQPTEIKLIGTKRIKNDDEKKDIWISDHFGLAAVLKSTLM